MKTPELQTSVEGHSPDAVVRPPWGELCKCVSVRGAVSSKRPRETEDGYKLRVAQTVRSNYESGSDWIYDADCELCESGLRRPNDEYRKVKREYLRENRMCEAHALIYPGEKAPVARAIHHSRGRIGSLLCDTTYFFSTCNNCHHWIHSFVKRARELGLIAPVGEWNTTAKTKHRTKSLN
jgi:hypothetical protein